MRVLVTTPFDIQDGSIATGTILDISSEILPKLTGLVELLPRYRQDLPSDRSPVPRAWVQNWELRTIGVFEDLASEIVKITSDDLELQNKLLTEHCQMYSPTHIHILIDAWEERAAILEYDAGMPRGDAELEASRKFHLEGFLDELRKPGRQIG